MQSKVAKNRLSIWMIKVSILLSITFLMAMNECEACKGFKFNLFGFKSPCRPASNIKTVWVPAHWEYGYWREGHYESYRYYIPYTESYINSPYYINPELNHQPTVGIGYTLRGWRTFYRNC